MRSFDMGVQVGKLLMWAQEPYATATDINFSLLSRKKQDHGRSPVKIPDIISIGSWPES
jgi:hypothetical protein